MVEIFQNIREIYDFRLPCPELAPFIEFFSESSPAKSGIYFVPNGHEKVKMFASWTPTIYINLSGPYWIDLDQTRYKVQAGEDILILRNGDVTRHNLPTDRIFTIKFYPGGLESITGINQTRLTDRLLPANHVLPATLLANVKQPLTFQERLDIIQSYLLEQHRQRHIQDHYLKIVNDAIGEYTAIGMQLNTSQVAENLFISSKTINRYFHRVVGVSPKSYFSIIRARTALTKYMQQKDHFSPWDHGYYDWSHFHKDIFKFTRQKISTPS